MRKKMVWVVAFCFLSFNMGFAMSQCSSDNPPARNCSEEEECKSRFENCEDKGCDHSWNSSMPQLDSDSKSAENTQHRKGAAQKVIESESR